ncbi:MAG: hypothetical protein QXJ06_03070 [Candidatus Aenigmatarchaeota archaeon]
MLIEPKQGFELLLFLEPGQHEIYVAVGNAEKTIDLNVPEKAEYKEEVNVVKENKIVLLVIVFIVIVALIVFLAFNKKKIIFNIKTKLI